MVMLTRVESHASFGCKLEHLTQGPLSTLDIPLPALLGYELSTDHTLYVFAREAGFSNILTLPQKKTELTSKGSFHQGNLFFPQ